MLQKKVIHIIAGVSYLAHTDSIFIKFRLLKFLDLVEINTLITMHKAYYGNLPYNLANYFVIDNRVMHFTRNQYKFKVQYVRTNIKSMCLSI